MDMTKAQLRKATNKAGAGLPVGKRIGDRIEALEDRKGVHVPNSAAAPTKADFDALLTSLRNAGLLATS